MGPISVVAILCLSISSVVTTEIRSSGDLSRFLRAFGIPISIFDDIEALSNSDPRISISTKSPSRRREISPTQKSPIQDPRSQFADVQIVPVEIMNLAGNRTPQLYSLNEHVAKNDRSRGTKIARESRDDVSDESNDNFTYTNEGKNESMDSEFDVDMDVGNGPLVRLGGSPHFIPQRMTPTSFDSEKWIQNIIENYLPLERLSDTRGSENMQPVHRFVSRDMKMNNKAKEESTVKGDSSTKTVEGILDNAQKSLLEAVKKVEMEQMLKMEETIKREFENLKTHFRSSNPIEKNFKEQFSTSRPMPALSVRKIHRL